MGDVTPAVVGGPGVETAPDYLVIGNVTKDVTPAGYEIGGTVSFSSVAAQRMGKRAAVLTRCESIPELRKYLEGQGVALLRVASDVTTTFENVYTRNGGRTQRIGPVAPPIPPDALPFAWRGAPVVHLGPIAQEVPAEMVDYFPAVSVIGATPQGWLREWDAEGRVRPTAWVNAEAVLARVDALIFSAEDVGGDQALVRRYCEMTKLAVVTDHRNGCTVWEGGRQVQFPAFEVEEVDPTGAGDTFATAFLIRYGDTRDAAESARFANCAASFVVGAVGISGLPSMEQVEERLRTGTLRQTA